MPCIKTTRMHAEHFAQPPHWELVPQLNDEGAPYADVLAKYTVAIHPISATECQGYALSHIPDGFSRPNRTC